MAYFPGNQITFNANQPISSSYGFSNGGSSHISSQQQHPQQYQSQPQSQPHVSLQNGGMDRARFMKRQASQLRSLYPLTRWCAVYVNTTAIGAKALNLPNPQVDDNKLLEPIEHYDVDRVNVELEEEIVVMTESQKQNEKDILEKQRQREEEKKYERLEKVQTLKSLASLNRDEEAERYLNQNEWDLEKAAEAVFASKVDVGMSIDLGNSMDLGNSLIDVLQPHKKDNDKALILLLLPDSRTYTFNMKASDTFWELYGQVVHVLPELSQKNITFVLSDDHKLQEDEFNQTLESCNCTPEGSVRVVFT